MLVFSLLRALKNQVLLYYNVTKPLTARKCVVLQVWVNYKLPNAVRNMTESLYIPLPGWGLFFDKMLFFDNCCIILCYLVLRVPLREEVLRGFSSADILEERLLARYLNALYEDFSPTKSHRVSVRVNYWLPIAFFF